MLKGRKDELLSWTDLGDSVSLVLNGDCVMDVVKFVCWLYDPNSPVCYYINEIRYWLFSQKGVSRDFHQP